jgi:hypothetical protein
MKLQKALTLTLITLAAITSPGSADGLNLDNMTGSQIREDIKESFKDESLFYINPVTGMSPGASGGSSVYTPPTTTGSPWSNVAGRWTLNLMDTESRSLDLTVYQIGNEVFGRGVMTTGANSQEMTAAGSIEGTALTLRLVSVGGDNMYRLRTAAGGDSIFGTYTAFSSYGVTWTGNCNGNRFYPSSLASPADSAGTVRVGASGGNAMA